MQRAPLLIARLPLGFQKISHKPRVIDHRLKQDFGRSIIPAARSITARTGVYPEPMIRLLVIKAPDQWVKLIISAPAMPGKKYLFPPEKPTTSWGKTGPQMMKVIIIKNEF